MSTTSRQNLRSGRCPAPVVRDPGEPRTATTVGRHDELTPRYCYKGSRNLEAGIPASLVQDMSETTAFADSAATHATRSGIPELFPVGVRAGTDIYSSPSFGVWHAGVGP